MLEDSYELSPAFKHNVSKKIEISSELIAEFLKGKSKRTREAYKDALKAFQEFSESSSESEAANKLLGVSHGEANLLAIGYRSWLIEKEFSPATINQKLSALRSLVEFANVIGLVPWKLKVKNLESQKYKDTRGPGQEGFELLLAEAKKQDHRKALRDVAILWLLFSRVFRREEVVSLDLEHFDGKNRVSVLRKRKTEREFLTISTQAAEALCSWIAVRGITAGPMFPNCDRAHKGTSGRITGKGLWQIVSTLGTRCGLTTWPHALRHAGITKALDLMGGDVRAVQQFSGHKDINVLLKYDDARRDQGGDVAQKLSDGVKV